jgi:hypothetical protein
LLDDCLTILIPTENTTQEVYFSEKKQRAASSHALAARREAGRANIPPYTPPDLQIDEFTNLRIS